MKTLPLRLLFAFVAALLCTAVPQLVFAGSATWSQNPISNDWNVAKNWVPETVPDGESDVASFGPSNMREVVIASSVDVSNVHFMSDAPAFTIAVEGIGINLFVRSEGILNDSAVLQSLSANSQSAIFFFDHAKAGLMTAYLALGGLFIFEDSSSGDAASFDVGTGTSVGEAEFSDSSTAANSTIYLHDRANVFFGDTATAASAVISTASLADVDFGTSSSAGNATITVCDDCSAGFTQSATADQSYITASGAGSSAEPGGSITLADETTAGEATFVLEGGSAPDAPGAEMTFFESATAGNATIMINGGVNGGGGAGLFFSGSSSGGTARLTISGNGQMDLSGHGRRLLTIGSLEGDGLVYLGARSLAVGSNNLSTTFSGVIQDGGSSGGSSGAISKVGAGTLTLSGVNTYTGGTTVSAGILNVANRTGSATGTGAVNVNAGTLGGSGIIAGASTIGTGSSVGAFLTPAVGTNKQATLSIQSALTFNSDATYTCTFKAKKNRAKTDKVIANGVTINGATLNLVGQSQGSLKRGLRLTLISNTSANPISGTFSNLPDDGIVTINGNNFQASYDGGDGNDLTLTVVP